ncbi:MAG: non-canonical purine NTP pyrophosphatase [Verrucomicrobiales bacterium]|nr:non-canonical purine NTP pyrophosphatase [Verrucomicrobiales bacterium]
MPPLVIATRNAHKVEEIQAVLGPRFRYLTLRDFPSAPEVDETGDTFEANARLKAESLAAWLRTLAPVPWQADSTPWSVLADDSGLEVDALGGAPGVQSARFASAEFGLSGNAPDGANNTKLLRLLAEVPAERRTARFRCVLALVSASDPHATALLASGSCEGRIGFVPRGAHGFGYDPLFVPDGFSATLAELGEATKNSISHRARALEALKAKLPR